MEILIFSSLRLLLSGVTQPLPVLAIPLSGDLDLTLSRAKRKPKHGAPNF